MDTRTSRVDKSSGIWYKERELPSAIATLGIGAFNTKEVSTPQVSI